MTSLLRANDPGWILCGMNDPTGRRGIWYRTTPSGKEESLTSLEICAGREGDDAHAVLLAGTIVTSQTLSWLADALDCGAWMVREHYLPFRYAELAVAYEELKDEVEMLRAKVGDK